MITPGIENGIKNIGYLSIFFCFIIDIYNYEIYKTHNII